MGIVVVRERKGGGQMWEGVVAKNANKHAGGTVC